MSVFEAIQARRSVGLMKPDLPPREKIERILEAATFAPNHHEVEPWRFVVLAGKAREEFGNLMAELLQEKLPDTTSEKSQAALAKERNKPLRAPVLIIAGSVEPINPKIVDIENLEAVAAAVQNMLLVAEEEGLAAIWRTGGPIYDTRVKTLFGFKPHEHIVAVVYLGYPAVPRPMRIPGGFQDKTEWRGWE